MRSFSRTFTLFLLVFFTTAYSISQDSCKMLFIGSSYFNWHDLPDQVAALSADAGKDVYIDAYIPSGLYLYDHAASPVTEAKINELDWDYVILQGVGSVTAYPDSFTAHPVYTALQMLQDKIQQNCESTQMFFCLPWAFEDGMTWYGWPDTYADMQTKIRINTLDYSYDLDFPVCPVGWCWYHVLEEQGYPLHYLHESDWNHPSLRGTYLMACALYSAVFQETTVGNGYYAGLANDEAMYFQEVGSSTVLDSLGLWNIPFLTRISSGEISLAGCVSDCYPNPATGKCYVDILLHERSLMEVKFINTEGVLVKKLRPLYRERGKHNIGLDLGGLKTGLYYLHFMIDNTSIVRKLILLKE